MTISLCFACTVQCIYGRAGQSMLLEKISCPVLHHNTTPTWYEEIKIRLPLNITASHHLLFSFVHVSCDLSKRRDMNTTYENAVGYAWMPLLTKGKINVDEQVLPVAASLPAGYLAIQSFGLGKGVRMFSFFVSSCALIYSFMQRFPTLNQFQHLIL